MFSTKIPRWERFAGESAVWYSRFMVFCELGPERTIGALFEALKARGEHLKYGWLLRRARKEDWWGRAKEWDHRGESDAQSDAPSVLNHGLPESGDSGV